VALAPAHRGKQIQRFRDVRDHHHEETPSAHDKKHTGDRWREENAPAREDKQEQNRRADYECHDECHIHRVTFRLRDNALS
jgi:hypothetical protein